MWTLESFNVFDDSRDDVETLTAVVTVMVPGEVDVYLRPFDRLAALAVYGNEARALITAAIGALG
jgi:hypothetical protein